MSLYHIIKCDRLILFYQSTKNIFKIIFTIGLSRLKVYDSEICNDCGSILVQSWFCELNVWLHYLGIIVKMWGKFA